MAGQKPNGSVVVAPLWGRLLHKPPAPRLDADLRLRRRTHAEVEQTRIAEENYSFSHLGRIG